MQITDKPFDALIIGGGVIGLACAYYLAKAGRKVGILEKDTVGSGASHGNCGLVVTSHAVPLCAPGAIRHEMSRMLRGTSPLYIKAGRDMGRFLWLLKFAAKCNPAHLKRAVAAREGILTWSRQLFDQLLSEEELPCEWEEKGMLLVYRDSRAMESYEETNRLLAPYGLAARGYVGKELRALEPALRDDVYGAWHHAGDTHLRPDQLMSSWASLIRSMDVEILENCGLEGFETDKGDISGIRCAKGRLSARHYLLTAGIWTPLIARQLSLRLPVQPGKGYSITMSRPAVCPKIPCYLHERSVVATPWPSGYRLGGTMEFSGFETHLNPRRLGKVLEAAGEYLREPLGNQITEEWTGLRPMTHDDLPIIGKVPGRQNLYLAAGHGMTGISMATGTGKLVEELLSGQSPHIDPRPFSPTRFLK